MHWCFWTVVLETTFAIPLDCTKIKPVHPKGNQSWIFIGRTDTQAEKPVIWPPSVKNWLTGKDPDAGKDWRQEEKGVTEDEMVVWHHWLDGHEFEQAVGVGDGPREARGAAVHGVAKSRTWLNNWNEWMIRGNRYLLFSGFFHHQLMWLQIECGTWITTLSSKGMKSGGSRGMFPNARTMQGKSTSSHIPWPGFILMWISLQWSCEIIGWGMHEKIIQGADFQKCTTWKLKVFGGGKKRTVAQETAYQIALRRCSKEAQRDIRDFGEGRVHVIMCLFFGRSFLLVSWRFLGVTRSSHHHD